MTGGDLASALDSLAPNAARTLPAISQLEVGSFANMLWDHLSGLGGSSATGTGATTAFRVDTDGLMLAQQSAAGLSASNALLSFGAQAGTGARPPAAVSPAQADGADMFGKGVGGFLAGSSLEGSVATGGGGEKASVNGYLIAVGIDLQPAANLTVGGSLAYSETTARMSLVPERTRSSSFQGVAYGRYESGDGWFVDGFAGTGSQRITVNRTVTTGSASYNLYGHTGGSSPTVGAAAGYEVVEQDFTITPTAGLQWLDAAVDGYTETGGPGAMTYKNVTRASLTGRVGFDAIGDIKAGTATIQPLVDAYLVQEFETGAGNLTAAFAGSPSALMSFGLAHRSGTWVELEVGAKAAIGDNTSIGIRYHASAGRSDLNTQAWTGEIDLNF